MSRGPGWTLGVFAERKLRRGDYIIHQEARRRHEGATWSLCSQLIQADDVVAVQLSKGIKSDNLRNLHKAANRHVAELEKEMEP